jgi:hypothetical protein
MTPKSEAEKRAAFLETANKSLKWALRQIDNLGSLGKHATKEDRAKILKALRDAVDQVEAKYNGKQTDILS